VYANPADPGAHAELLGLLHSPHRVACRLVMILLSHQGWSPAAIASLLGYDPLTVRRWLHRYNHEGVVGLIDRPRPGRPRLGDPRLGERIRRLLAEPRGVDGRAPVPAARPPRHEHADPAPARPRGRLLAATPAGRQRRP
jgi:hypothetical protein